MGITYDPAKQEWTLVERGLDFRDAERVFAGITFDRIDDRKDYGEERVITVGTLDGRMVVLVWTRRDGTRHIISMRKANEREQARFKFHLDRP
nr:BrnT family toxin [Mangrovicella endophytica]